MVYTWCSIRLNTSDSRQSKNVGQLYKCLIWASKTEYAPKKNFIFLPTGTFDTQFTGFEEDQVNLTYVKHLK